MSSNEVYCPRNVTESITELSKYIYNKLRVTIEDRREFIGYFMCIDKNKNIILSATNEYSIKEEILEKEEKENKENTTNEEKKVERLPDECCKYKIYIYIYIYIYIFLNKYKNLDFYFKKKKCIYIYLLFILSKIKIIYTYRWFTFSWINYGN